MDISQSPSPSYAVIRTGEGRMPFKPHTTKEDAVTEASRLCQKEKDEFYVIEFRVIKRVRLASPPVDVIDLEKN
jgi:hypothetical protein